MYDESCIFTASPLKKNVHIHVSSSLFYMHTSNMPEITIVGDLLLTRFIPSGNIDDPDNIADTVYTP